MIAHQRQRLSEFLRNNRNMKLNIRTEGLFEKPEYDDGGTEIGSQELIYALPSTYYPIHNQDELTQALEDSVKQILLQIQNLEGSTSNLRFQNIFSISPALQPNSKRTICDWQRLGPAAWISDRVLPTWFPESINRPHIRAGVLKISRGTDNVKSSCTHRQSTRKRTCANLLTIVPTVIAAQ